MKVGNLTNTQKRISWLPKIAIVQMRLAARKISFDVSLLSTWSRNESWYRMYAVATRYMSLMLLSSSGVSLILLLSKISATTQSTVVAVVTVYFNPLMLPYRAFYCELSNETMIPKAKFKNK